MSEQNPQGQPQGGQPQMQQVQVLVREDKTNTVYGSNLGVSMTPNLEEFVIDVATMSPARDRQNAVVMDVSTRVLMSPFWAKRLALMLSQAVQRYEQQFGMIELDPGKRMKQG